jgi:outer membrane protein OmpA-like peptidoglycan-associated protein
MTDMMVGMLFLFILMLMFFALKFNEATVQINKTNEILKSAEETRTEILQDLERSLKDMGVAVEIDVENGILRLPENILFERNRSDLTGPGRDAIVVLGRSLDTVLHCYASIPGETRPNTCPDTPHTVEAIFVEGHTDSDGEDALNWNLSVQRGLNTYQAMVDNNPKLAQLHNTKAQAILSVSGYGKQRPVQPNDTVENKRQNRRIDLRFIMTTPKAKSVKDIEQKVEEQAR